MLLRSARVKHEDDIVFFTALCAGMLTRSGGTLCMTADGFIVVWVLGGIKNIDKNMISVTIILI